MSAKDNNSISLEDFSAFLDGNLPDAEMKRVSSAISNNDFLLDMLQENMEIEEAEAYYGSSDLQPEISAMESDGFALPDLQSFSEEEADFFALDDIWNDSEGSNNSVRDEIMDPFANEVITNAAEDMKSHVNYGYEPNHSESTFDHFIYQGNQPSCAVRSQEIVLRDYGISIPQEELIKFAMEQGWYSPDPENGGTPRDATGNILDALGVETRRYDNATIFDIISELRAGHRIIVSVDANELWVKNEPNLYKRLFGEITNKIEDKIDNLAGRQGANHALIVAGVNVDPKDPSDMRVVLIDSGSGDVCIEYKFSAFQNAWDDSHCHMITTTQAAPFQYNYETHRIEPSNFQTDFMPSMVALPAGLHNQFELPSNYFDVYGDITPHYNEWEHITPLWENWSDEESHDHQMVAKCAAEAWDDDAYSSDEEDERSSNSDDGDGDDDDDAYDDDFGSESYDDDGGSSDLEDDSDF